MFSRNSLPQGPKVETRKALILVDFQNDFTAVTGQLYVANTNAILTKLPTLISKFREGGQIIWTQSIFSKTHSSQSSYTGGYEIVFKDLAAHLKQEITSREEVRIEREGPDATYLQRAESPILHEDEESFLGDHVSDQHRCCVQNSSGAELSSELEYVCDRERDMVISKSRYSALSNLSSVTQLRARMINDLYICGTLSNIGVYATVLDAVRHGFNVTLVEDCLGFREDICHIEAMRRMADELGANGTDYQELMDDLCGLLGDVIPASHFTRNFQLSVHPSSIRGTPLQTQRQPTKVNKVDGSMGESLVRSDIPSSIYKSQRASNDPTCVAAPHNNESYSSSPSQATSKCSPSRKRSTGDIDDQDVTRRPDVRPLQSMDGPSPMLEAKNLVNKSTKRSKIEPSLSATTPNRPPPTHQNDSSALDLMRHSKSTSHVETEGTLQHASKSDRAMSLPNPFSTSPHVTTAAMKKRPKRQLESSYLGQGDVIGTGDTTVIYDVLPGPAADEVFHVLRAKVAWQKMYHRTGEVPRLVAVQGDIADDGSIPIYRHPADESPPLLPFDEQVNHLRQRCETLVGHRLNHVLIQYYRNSDDNISEHSDKTLDIVRGSSIVNLSLGAMRTMTLRSKKPSERRLNPGQTGDSTPVSTKPKPTLTIDSNTTPRTAQRIRLPHNSLFVLGERTNTNWLHSIRADKRPEVEKSGDELAFGCERISLTFRHIGTFVNLEKQLIWGQGATNKGEAGARKILEGKEAEIVGEEMIIGFGKENHLTEAGFDWELVYGSGFDVVNFEVRTG